ALACFAQLVQQEMAAIALELLRAELSVAHHRVPGFLPARDPTRHRRDPRVAHGAQHLGGQQRARPTGTVDHNVRIGLGQLLNRPEFQETPRDGDGTLNIARTYFLFLSHVEYNHLVTMRAACRHSFDADLRDRPARLVEEIVGGVWHSALLSLSMLP